VSNDNDRLNDDGPARRQHTAVLRQFFKQASRRRITCSRQESSGLAGRESSRRRQMLAGLL
jgi:hypothetical protein